MALLHRIMPVAREMRRRVGARVSGVNGMAKWVYSFGDGEAEGSAEMRNLLGGKGANLAEMANLGLPVPPGFTITTEVCTHYYANGQTLPARPRGRSRCRRSPRIEQITGKTLGGDERRSSSRCAPAPAPRCRG